MRWQEGHLEFMLLRDGEGFSTVGVVIALLITLSLVFTGAQVYQVQSAASEVQEVADACALAAENVVAEYYLAARVCDAIVLSLTLTGIVALGVGVAALCTPFSAKAGEVLVSAGRDALKARDTFAEKAAEGLGKLQQTLPFFAAAAALRVAGANRGAMDSGYFGFAVLAPLKGEAIEVGTLGAADSLLKAVDESDDDLKQAGKEAEEAAERANEAKERAFRADCGDNPSHCMYERASTLAGLSGAANPLFSNADTWGFSVALERAQAYYPKRLVKEAPTGSSVDERANSALRKRFYRYAVQKLGEGYVRESGDSFEAHFPLLPKNTSELRGTSLFTETAYPITVNGEGLFVMHAWDGCPGAVGVVGQGSLAQREAGDYALCPSCRFTASSLGKVAAASSSIDNGFEYHYRIVAAAAKEYEQAKKDFVPKAQRVRHLARSLFDQAVAALRKMASQRIVVAPPGRFGAVALVASTDTRSASYGFASAFVGDGGVLGARVALSAATLVSDSPEQGRTVLSSLLDGVKEETGSSLVGVLDGVMDVWSAVLFAYADGQERIGEGIDELDAKLSFDSESRLGLWSSKQFKELMESLGLQPVEMDAPKPVVVNSGHVLGADGGSAFSARLLAVKRAAAGLSGNTLFEGVIGGVERYALSKLDGIGDEFTIAEIELLGDGGPTIPLTIAVPDAARENSTNAVLGVADALRRLAGGITGVRQWR